MSNLAVSGREAERLGLVERCVPAGQVLDEALRLARDIVKSGSATVRLLKKNLGLKRNELQAELERNALQQAKDFQTGEYRARIAPFGQTQLPPTVLGLHNSVPNVRMETMVFNRMNNYAMRPGSLLTTQRLQYKPIYEAL